MTGREPLCPSVSAWGLSMALARPPSPRNQKCPDAAALGSHENLPEVCNVHVPRKAMVPCASTGDDDDALSAPPLPLGKKKKRTSQEAKLSASRRTPAESRRHTHSLDCLLGQCRGLDGILPRHGPCRAEAAPHQREGRTVSHRQSAREGLVAWGETARLKARRWSSVSCPLASRPRATPDSLVGGHKR